MLVAEAASVYGSEYKIRVVDLASECQFSELNSRQWDRYQRTCFSDVISW